jgi:mRNA interferase MazF
MKIDRIQLYMEWMTQKIALHLNAENAAKRSIKRGEVYYCYLGRNVGSEEEKRRPCVILQIQSQNNRSPNTIVAPITHTESTLDVVVPISPKKDKHGNVILDGNVLLGNIVTISKSRIDTYITDLLPDEMKKIDKAIAISLGIYERYQSLETQYNNKVNHINNLNRKIDKLQLENEKLKLNS